MCLFLVKYNWTAVYKCACTPKLPPYDLFSVWALTVSRSEWWFYWSGWFSKLSLGFDFCSFSGYRATLSLLCFWECLATVLKLSQTTPFPPQILMSVHLTRVPVVELVWIASMGLNAYAHSSGLGQPVSLVSLLSWKWLEEKCCSSWIWQVMVTYVSESKGAKTKACLHWVASLCFRTVFGSFCLGVFGDQLHLFSCTLLDHASLLLWVHASGPPRRTVPAGVVQACSLPLWNNPWDQINHFSPHICS